MRKVLTFLEYYEAHPDKQMAKFFTDAGKGLERHDFITVKKEIGELFIDAIKAIYKKQRAKIKINGEHSEEIEIKKGMRQGCTLSPSLYWL